MRDAEFFPEQMQKNIDRTLGLFGAGFVKDALLENGIISIVYDGEEVDVYSFVQNCAFEAWARQSHIADVLRERGAFKLFSDAEEVLAKCFINERFLVHIDAIFARFEPLGTEAV
jgi:adenylosuccinate lyase